jgi:tetratricopeptide (TPR) repeat protein
MTISIFIEEHPHEGKNFRATVRFGEHGSPYPPLFVENPTSVEQERELEWYFEEWLNFPFTDKARADHAADCIRVYGESLFAQVFRSDPDIYMEYQTAIRSGDVMLQVIGSPEFHALHWEALNDPNQLHPLAVDQPVVRKNRQSVANAATLSDAPELRVLLVTARPSGRRDVGYRTISRPLIEALETGKLRATIDIVRPGSFKALLEHLETTKLDHGGGYYHMLHLDLHGAVLTYDEYQKVACQAPASSAHLFKGYGTSEVEPYTDEKAFLMFEEEELQDGNGGFLVSAEDIADQLRMHQIPIVALNACQSGKQVGNSATETSLGSRLLASGAQLVIAMGYSVTVSAARIFMTRFYRELLDGREPATAIRAARLELHRDKARRAAYNKEIVLEDWMLPVIYQNTPVQFRFSAAAPGAASAVMRYSKPATAYGFVGRDLDVLEIERRLLLRGNLLLVQGMGGAGKSTLLHHLGWWWQKTRFVEQVFYFGYDLKAWRLPEIIAKIGEQLGLPQSGRMQDDRYEVARALKHTRHLLMLDNMESITGERLSIPNTLSEAERQELKGFLLELQVGKTLMLLGSRGDEAWLHPNPLSRHRIYDLPGLDKEASSQLADKILRQIGAPNYPDQRAHRDAFRRLMRLLGGYPLAMEVVLSNLARSTPAEMLVRLEAADIDLDNQSATAGKTDSIIKCIDYSHSNLSESAQQLLLTLAPFTGVVNKKFLDNYSERLLAQPALAGLPCDKWEEVLREAEKMGLLKPHEDEGLAEFGYLSLQPVFPFFLKSRLNDPAQAERKEAIETAFREHYEGIGDYFGTLFYSKEAEPQQAGVALISVEYENLYTALQIALRQQKSIESMFCQISNYLDKVQQQEQGLELGKHVLRALKGYSIELLQGQIALDMVSVIVDEIGTRALALRDYQVAEQAYSMALKLCGDLTIMLPENKAIIAIIFHQLGIVAQRLREWKDAEGYYKKGLDLFIELKDFCQQGFSLAQLGSLALQQRMFEEAKDYYKKALVIFVDLKAYFDQAGVFHQMGIIAQEQGELDDAKKYYNKSKGICEDYREHYEKAKPLHGLGNVALLQGKLQDAKRFFKEALIIEIEYKDRHAQAATLGQLGMLSEKQQQWDEAQAYALEAAAIFFEFNDQYNLVIALGLLGRIWRANKDSSLIEKVAALLNIPASDCEAKLDEAAARPNPVTTRSSAISKHEFTVMLHALAGLSRAVVVNCHFGRINHREVLWTLQRASPVVYQGINNG